MSITNNKNNVKLGESFEGKFGTGAAQPNLFQRDSFHMCTPKIAPSSPFLGNSLSMNLSNLPTFGRGRPVGIMRPTPHMGGIERTKSIKMTRQTSLRRGDSKEDLSPRSKMLPNLKEKMNTIKGGGSFIKFERKTPRQMNRLESFGTELKKIGSNDFSVNEEKKTITFPKFNHSNGSREIRRIRPQQNQQNPKER